MFPVGFLRAKIILRAKNWQKARSIGFCATGMPQWRKKNTFHQAPGQQKRRRTGERGAEGQRDRFFSELKGFTPLRCSVIRSAFFFRETGYLLNMHKYRWSELCIMEKTEKVKK